MSDVEGLDGKRRNASFLSRRHGNADYPHSYWIGLSTDKYQKHIPYREALLCDRILQLITHACRADHAALIMSDYSFIYDGIDKIHVHPEPTSDEEAVLWKYVAAYIGESVRLGTPLNIPESLQEALNLGTVQILPASSQNEGTFVVAIFNKSSSPPLNHEDENILRRLTDEFVHVFHTAVSPKNRRARSHKVSRVLRARNVLLSISELCTTLDGLIELVVSMKLAESACVRILDEDTNMLKLVATAGKKQGIDTYPRLPATDCSIMQLAPNRRTPRCMNPHQCFKLSRSENLQAICAPVLSDSGAIGVLSLWNPPKEGLSPEDMRIIDAVALAVEKVFLDTCIFPAGSKTWERTGFVEYASIASRASGDITHTAREILAGLRRSVNFQVGAFVNCRDGMEVFSVLFSLTVPLIIGSVQSEDPDMERGFPAYGTSGDTCGTIILGDPEAEEWADRALEELESDRACMFIRPFYMRDSRWPSCLVVPLVSGGEIIGLFICGKPEGDKFTNEEMSFCESVRHDLILLWENFMARVKPKTSPAIEVMLERIETLEQLAVGTAHEIKNPLAVIKGYMQVLQFDQGISQEIRQRIERLLRQVDQISRIADDLAGLAKLSAIDISMISISDLLEEVLDAIKPQAVSKGISIVRRYPDDIPEICGDAGKLEQAFLNICRNAVEAMGTKGDELRITIRISSDSRNMEVEFCDTGPGISREAMTMMFTPFFTTKRHGTGLGLNISMHIARLHGGTIRAESVQGGKGAIFTVILPLARNSHLR